MRTTTSERGTEFGAEVKKRASERASAGRVPIRFCSTTSVSSEGTTLTMAMMVEGYRRAGFKL